MVSSETKKEWPDPILELQHILGFSTSATKTLLWVSNGSAFIYASYSTIVVHYIQRRQIHAEDRSQGDVTSNQCEFSGDTQADSDPNAEADVLLLGHIGEISTMAMAVDGTLLASAEAQVDSNPCCIRVWDLAIRECVTVVRGHGREIHSLCFSNETQSRGLLLCGVGLDELRRTQILVWDCSGIRKRGATTSHRPTLAVIARQTSDFPVRSIAFSPYEQQHPCLVSCGRENIRYWRVASDGHIVGNPVILKEYSRGTVFNDIAFDPLCESFPSNISRIRPLYAASSVGTLLVIDYDTREVVCAYQLHDASINCLVINEGFCVTGSDDRFLRVWPLDFSDFFLEAQHESAVVAADVSRDGMSVLVGSNNSAVGVLDISNQVYKTVLRSHEQPIVGSTLLPWCSSPIDQATLKQTHEVLTASRDGTLRLWDTLSGDQLYELDVQHDQVTCLQASIADHGVVAVGFVSGCCRIFDMHKLSVENGRVVLTEIQQHKSTIRDVQFTGDGQHLYTSGAGKQLCMYDARQREFIPLKMLVVEFNRLDGRLSISRDNKYLAVVDEEQHGVLLLQCASLRMHCTVTPPKPSHSTGQQTELKLALFSRTADTLFMISKTDRLHIYSMTSRQFVRTMPLLGQAGVTAAAITSNSKYLATGGGDGSLRVWKIDASGKFERMFQSFLGHSGAITDLEFTSDCKHIVATGDSSSAFVWHFLGDCSMSSPVSPAMISNPLLTDDEKENRFNPSSCNIRQPELVHSNEDTNQVHSPVALSLTDDQVNEAMSPSLVVPVPSSKPTLELSLGKDALVYHTSPARSEAAVTPIPVNSSISTTVMTIEPTVEGTLALSSVISGLDPSQVAWAPPLGKLVYSVGSILCVEEIETMAVTCLAVDGGTDNPLASQQSMLLRLSSSHDRVAVVSSHYGQIKIYCLRCISSLENERPSTCSCHSDRACIIQLPEDTSLVSALEFSSGDTSTGFVCFSSEHMSSQFRVSLARVDGAVVWSSSTTYGVQTILSVDRQRFLLFCPENSRLQQLVVHADSDEAGSSKVNLDNLFDRSPLNILRVAASPKVSGDDIDYLVGLDSDHYCCFYDLRAQAFIAASQLLPASTGKRRRLHSVDVLVWSFTRKLQSMLVCGCFRDDFVCVHALPMKSTKFSARPKIDWQRVARSGISLTHAIDLRGGPLRSLSADLTRGVALVATQDGTVSIIEVDQPNATKQLRDTSLHHLGEKRHVASGAFSAADVGWAINDSLLVTRGVDDRAVRVWLPEFGREVVRFEAPGTTARCSSVAIDSATSLMLAAYTDGSLRLFDISSERLIAQFRLDLDRHQASLPDRAKQTRSLRSLHQRHRLRTSPEKHPQRDSRQFKQLEFLGTTAALAVTRDGRLFWMDLARAIAESGGSNNERTASARLKTPIRDVQEVVYQEVDLSPKRQQRVQRSRRNRHCQVISLHVASDTSRSGGPGFIVVLRVTYLDGSEDYVVQVFAEIRMQVLSEDQLLPTDEWTVAALSDLPPVAIFIGTDRSRNVCVLFSRPIVPRDNNESAQWCLEVRDCTDRMVTQRLDFPSSDPALWVPVHMSMLPATALGDNLRSIATELVLLVESEGRMVLVDLDNSSVIPVDTTVACAMEVRLTSAKAIGSVSGRFALSSISSAADGIDEEDGTQRSIADRLVVGNIVLKRK